MFASRGNVVLLPATIAGMERKADCEVLARRLGIEPLPVFSDCSVIGAPEDWPDGDYTIEFEKVRATVTKQRGLWMTFDPPSENLEQSAIVAD